MQSRGFVPTNEPRNHVSSTTVTRGWARDLSGRDRDETRDVGHFVRDETEMFQLPRPRRRDRDHIPAVTIFTIGLADLLQVKQVCAKVSQQDVVIGF